MARAQNTYVFLKAGTYYHSGILTVDSAELRGEGDGTVLEGRDAAVCSIKLSGTAPKLRNCLVRTSYTGAIVANSPERLSTDDSTLVWVAGATDFVLDNVTVERGRSAGIFISDSGGSSESSRARVTNCRVRSTLADGIHMTNGSRFITVQHNNVSNTGDDCIAVVSYKYFPDGTTPKDKAECRAITVDDNEVGHNVFARGISVVGGGNVTITDNSISDTWGAGLYLASEDSYQTYGTHDVLARHNTIVDANLPEQSGQNGITVFGRAEYPTRNISLIGNTILNVGNHGAMFGAHTENVSFIDNTIDTTTGSGIEILGAKNVEIKGRAADGLWASRIRNTGKNGIYANEACSGYLRITSNLFERINLSSGESWRDVVFVGNSQVDALAIMGNHLAGPLVPVLERYIECQETTYTTPVAPLNTRESSIASLPSLFSP